MRGTNKWLIDKQYITSDAIILVDSSTSTFSSSNRNYCAIIKPPSSSYYHSITIHTLTVQFYILH